MTGNTLPTAGNLGTLSGRRTISDLVGTTDPIDIFRFTLAQNSDLGITFRGLSETVSVFLVADQNNNGVIDRGETVDSGSAGFNGGSFSEPLPAGTYFVGVEPRFSNRSTQYELSLNVVQRPGNVRPDPGNTLNTAFNLRNLSGTRTLRDYVGVLDGIDIYRFTLTQNSDVGVTFRGPSDSINVSLVADINNNGVIDSGETIDSESGNVDSFSEPLPNGNYFVVVAPLFNSSSRRTNYELTLNSVARPGNVRPEPGNTLNTAFNLRNLSGTRTLRDYVGVLDEVDIYRFTLTRNSDVGVTFRGLSTSVNVSLVADLNNNGVIDSGETIDRESGSVDSFSESLAIGNYFVVVAPLFGGRSRRTNYELTLSQTPDFSGNDVLTGTPRRDVLRGLGGNDRISGLGGNDNLLGGDGNDRLIGGSSNDRLVGGTGSDTLLGGSGNDRLIGGNDNDRLLGAGGRDVLRGNQGNDILNAGGGNDSMFGGDGNDTLNGQAGNDNLRGGAGRDVLTGGPGNDTLNGGLGNDVIVAGPGRDRIITILEARAFDQVRDFTPGQDKIVLGGGLSVNQIRVQRQGRNTRVLFGGETFLLLQGVNPGQLSASDFI